MKGRAKRRRSWRQLPDETMGHLFKPKYKARDGTVRETKKYYYELWDKARRKRVRGVAYTDRKASEHLLRQLEQEQDRVDAGYLPAGTALAKVALSAHLDIYLGHLRAKGNKIHHVDLVGARCQTILDGCGFERWRDLEPLKLEHFLSELRAGTAKRKARTRKSISAQTSNHYLSQFSGFVAWLAERMQAVSPLTRLEPLNAQADRRHIRRVLTGAEMGRLIRAAAAGGVLFGIPGPDRAMLYWCAAFTGFRASELASMTPESMSAVGGQFAVTVEAGYAKNGRQDTVPMAAAVAKDVRTWLAGKAPSDRLWPGEWAAQHHAAAMLREDLAAAKIPYKDGRGRVVDFHALRATFITWLAKAGVPLIQAQKLARHSDPRLTANIYTLLDQSDLATETAKLLPPPKDETAA